MKKPAPVYPSEAQEQEQLAAFLDHLGVLWCHVPNGGRRSIQAGRKFKREGVKAGVPDVLIFSPPPGVDGSVGCALELKRVKGGVVSVEQRAWLAALKAKGWCTHVARGADDAIAWLTGAMGYRRRT